MLSLSIEQSLLACCLVLVVGRLLTKNVGVLSRYSIPDPIVGGRWAAPGGIPDGTGSVSGIAECDRFGYCLVV